MRFEVDARGRVVRVIDRVEPTPGNDVQLTVDLKVQQFAEMVLERGLEDPDPDPARQAGRVLRGSGGCHHRARPAQRPGRRDGDVPHVRQPVVGQTIPQSQFDASTAQPQERERLQHGDVHFATRHDGQRRCTEQSIALDIPAGAGQLRMASGRQRRETGERGAVDERAAAAGRQPEQVAHPLERDVLERRRGGRHHAQGDVLIQALASQLAATEAGRAPPFTKPK